MTRNIAVAGALAAIVAIAAAAPAQAGFGIHYTSKHVQLHGHFGLGFHWPAYTYYYTVTPPVVRYVAPPVGYYYPYSVGTYSPYYFYSGYAYPPGYAAWPSYRYGYYRYYGAYPYVDPYLPSDYLREERRTVVATAGPVVTETKVIVQGVPAAPAPTEVTVRSEVRSWDRNEWRVSPEAAARVRREVEVILGGEPPAREQAPALPADRVPAYPRAEHYRDAADEYLALLIRGDDDARQKAARELRKFGTAKVVEALVDALQKDGKNEVREEAARSLGEMLARAAQPALRKAAREDRDKDVREAALKAAQKIEAVYNIRD